MTGLNGHGPKANYLEIAVNHRLAYDRMAAERDLSPIPQWKLEERLRFLAVMKHERRRLLLDVGAGTGVHARFFQDEGLEVVCTDASPEMVRLCQGKRLIAHVMDFMDLDFGGQQFHAAFAMNCLLHVPRASLSAALNAIRGVVEPGGLFYLGQYGGMSSEAVDPMDRYDPKRFFSFFTDDEIMQAAGEVFELVRFCRVLLPESRNELYFQSLVMRRPK